MWPAPLPAQSRERSPRRDAQAGAQAAIGALRDCRRAAADATGAPWIVESSAERCERAEQQGSQAPDELRGSSGSCWDALWRAIREMRAANRLYEQARRARAPEQRRLMDEARGHHRAANQAIAEADRCIQGVARLVMQLLQELRGRGRRERPQPRPRPSEIPPSTRPWPSDPWGIPPAAADEEPCQDSRLGLRQIPYGGIDRIDGGFAEGAEQPEQLQSNHPERIRRLPGPLGAIALSTLSPRGRLHPEAHLDHAFSGPFRVLVSHQNRTGARLWQTLVLHNPGSTDVDVTVDALAGTDTTEAPYFDLGGRAFPALAPNPGASTANGPGDRTATRILLGDNEGPPAGRVPAGQTRILHTQSHPADKELVTQAELYSDAPVQAAVVYTPTEPTPAALERLLSQGALLPRSPDDPVATPPGAPGALIYGRVAGVVARSTFVGALTNDRAYRRFLTVPGCERRYAFNTRRGGPKVDLGTGVDQAAPLAVGPGGRPLRYSDAAYANNGNYGAEFVVHVEMHNPTSRGTLSRLCIDTPASIGGGVSRALRNTLAVSLDGGPPAYWYANQAVGTISPDPCIEVSVAPGGTRHVKLRLFYAANNTSPHTLRIKTEGRPPGGRAQNTNPIEPTTP